MIIHYAVCIEFTPHAADVYKSLCGINDTDPKAYTKKDGKAARVTCDACVKKIVGAKWKISGIRVY